MQGAQNYLYINGNISKFNIFIDKIKNKTWLKYALELTAFWVFISEISLRA